MFINATIWFYMKHEDYEAFHKEFYGVYRCGTNSSDIPGLCVARVMLDGASGDQIDSVLQRISDLQVFSSTPLVIE